MSVFWAKSFVNAKHFLVVIPFARAFVFASRIVLPSAIGSEKGN